MSEQDMVQLLGDALWAYAEAYVEDDEDLREALMGAETFEEAGLPTGNKGLVVRLKDAEFQITIMQSR